MFTMDNVKIPKINFDDYNAFSFSDAEYCMTCHFGHI